MHNANRKVINATPTTIDGIKFKSIMESRIYKELLTFGILPEYEVGKVVLVEGFKPKHIWLKDGVPQRKKLINITYTPDFTFKYCGVTVYLEVKGFITDRYPLKRKMILKYLELCDTNVLFAEIRNIAGLHKTLSTIQNITGQSSESLDGISQGLTI